MDEEGVVEEDDEEEVGGIRKWMEQYDEESSSLADMPV